MKKNNSILWILSVVFLVTSASAYAQSLAGWKMIFGSCPAIHRTIRLRAQGTRASDLGRSLEAEEYYQRAAVIDHDCRSQVTNPYGRDSLQLLFLIDSVAGAKTNSRVLQLYDMTQTLITTTRYQDVKKRALGLRAAVAAMPAIKILLEARAENP